MSTRPARSYVVRSLLGWVAVGTLLGATLGTFISYHTFGAAFRFVHYEPELVVGGLTLPSTKAVEHWLEKKSDALTNVDVLLATGEEFIPLRARDLGFELDALRTLARVRLATPKISWLDRVEQAFQNTPRSTYVEPAYRFHSDVAVTRLRKLAPHLHREPIDAELDVRARRRIEDQPGRELDVTATLRVLEATPLHPEPVVPVAYRTLPARVKSSDLLPVDVTRMLASFETDFAKKAGARAVNIRRTAELLDGFVIDPGATFSFNKVVGPRTEERGFTWAPVIVNDEMEPGLGGGVCQAASTVHAAAVIGGLEVIERRSHSRPSGYAPLGLDAAVIYGEVDLKIKNPYPVALLVHAYLPSRFVIRVEFLGADPPGRVEHEYAVLERHDFYRRIVENPSLGSGQFERTQDGGYGYDILSLVRTTYPDGTQLTRRYKSTYYPVPEVFGVGPGTDPWQLPELPDGASRVEMASHDDEPDSTFAQ